MDQLLGKCLMSLSTQPVQFFAWLIVPVVSPFFILCRYLTDHGVPKWIVIVVGYLVTALGYLLLGPAPHIFPTKTTKWMTIPALLLRGAGTAMCFNPLMPLIMDAAKKATGQDGAGIIFLHVSSVVN